MINEPTPKTDYVRRLLTQSQNGAALLEVEALERELTALREQADYLAGTVDVENKRAESAEAALASALRLLTYEQRRTWQGAQLACEQPSAEQVPETATRWLCGCGWVNGCELAVCSACNRTVGEGSGRLIYPSDLSKIAAPQNETSQGSRLTIRSDGVVADSSAGAAPHIASDDARGISQRDVPCRTHLMINCERCFTDAPQPSPD